MNSNHSAKRTDLAVEEIPEQLCEGVTLHKRGKAFSVTEIIIDSDKSGESIGKRRGRYITMESGSIAGFPENFNEMAQELADELSSMLPEGTVLVCGLGNSDITPDALGPQTASGILATRHFACEPEIAEQLHGFREVAVLSAGVLGQTGIETAELVNAICGKIHPCAVIAVDALACSDLSRLGTTVQLSDSGISPGSGVQNRRCELSEDTLGIPVLALGVPTVVDMHTIVESVTGAAPPESTPNLMVTPRDIDKLTQRAAKLLSAAINRCLQPQLSFEEIEGLGS